VLGRDAVKMPPYPYVERREEEKEMYKKRRYLFRFCIIYTVY
jgi:hypothetical protein